MNESTKNPNGGTSGSDIVAESKPLSIDKYSDFVSEKKALTKEEFLNKTSGGKIIFEREFRVSLPHDGNVKYPYGIDQHASVSINEKDGKWLYKDYGQEGRQGDVFNLLADKYGLNVKDDFHKIIAKASEDFGLVSKPPEYERGDDFTYWNRYGISESTDLVFPIKWYETKSGKKIEYTQEDPVFCFDVFEDESAIKIYRPITNTGYKHTWIGNLSGRLPVFNLPDNLKDKKVVVVEGHKDCFVLNQYIPEGYHVIGIDQVKTPMPDIVLHVDPSNRYLMLDNDEDGRTRSDKECREHGFMQVFTPLPYKDISDLIASYIQEDMSHEDIQSSVVSLLNQAELISPLVSVKYDVVDINYAFTPEQEEPIIRVYGKEVLSAGNLMGIIGLPGTGKSQTFEALSAKWINSDIDAFGFSFKKSGDKSTLLYVDTGRSLRDSKRGFERICQRIDVDTNPYYKDGDNLSDYRFKSFKLIPRPGERLEKLIRLIETGDYGLIFIDEITGLIADPNSLTEAQEVAAKLSAAADVFNIGILYTIHPNSSKEDSKKPRGHIGSELHRISESMFLIVSEPKDRNVRRITSVFDYGKVRNDNDQITTHFAWNEEQGMFLSTDWEAPKAKGRIDYQGIMTKAFGSTKGMGYMNLARKIVENTGRSLDTAKHYIKDATTLNILRKEDNQYYLA